MIGKAPDVETYLAEVSADPRCIRFTRPEKMDFALIEQLLRRSAGSDAAPC